MCSPHFIMLCVLCVSFFHSLKCFSQVWKTLPEGVRAVGYRNVRTSDVTKSFDNFGNESVLGSSFELDAETFDSYFSGALKNILSQEVYHSLTAGAFKIDASANLEVHGSGFAYGLTDKVMLYGEIGHYRAVVRTNIKRVKRNNFKEISQKLESSENFENQLIAENITHIGDINEEVIQAAVTNYYGYEPIGNWYGSGYGDMEVGAMIKVFDHSNWGLMIYPGVILPTGRVDNPDVLQDIGFGDGQWDIFSELNTGYIINQYLSLGSRFRYTYQLPGSKTLRIPDSYDFSLSQKKGRFNVKYGNIFQCDLLASLHLNDWLILTPLFRYKFQERSRYDSPYDLANSMLTMNTHRKEHIGQLTATISSLTPFMKKEFSFPFQLNFNYLKTLSGENVPIVDRYEFEVRFLF